MLFHDYAIAQSLEDSWLVALDEQKVEYVLLNRWRDQRLLHAMGSRPSWKVDLQDGDAVLYTRSTLLRDGKGLQ